MKRIFAAFLSVIVASQMAFFAPMAKAQSNLTDATQVKAQMADAYNQLASMNGAQYTAAVLKTADLLEGKGQHAKAEALRAMSAPSFQPIALEKIKGAIDNQSENGLWLIFIGLVLLSGGSFECYGGGCVLTALLIILTLDGDQAASY